MGIVMQEKYTNNPKKSKIIKKKTKNHTIVPKNHPKNLIPEEIPKVFGVCGPG